jgi:hypothetical protein
MRDIAEKFVEEQIEVMRRFGGAPTLKREEREMFVQRIHALLECLTCPSSYVN